MYGQGSFRWSSPLCGVAIEQHLSCRQRRNCLVGALWRHPDDPKRSKSFRMAVGAGLSKKRPNGASPSVHRPIFSLNYKSFF